MTLHELYHAFPADFPLPFILDGATGTALMHAGMPHGACPERWILENPAVLEKIQRGYIESGSDAVYAPTFGANPPSLAKHGITDTDSTNSSLAAISLKLCHSCNCKVGGDMSPTGLFLEPYGDATFDDIASAYAAQAAALERENVDFFVIETSISLGEVRAAVTGVRSVSDRPVFVTMTVDKSGRTMSGDTLEASLVTLAPLGINAFGANCSVGPDEMLKTLSPLVPLSLAFGIPLIAKPNAGMPRELEDGSQIFDLSADDFAAYAPHFLDHGIFILGGCCGTDAGYIAALRSAADAYSPSPDRLAAITLPDITRLAATTRVVVKIDTEKLDPSEAHPVDDELTDYDSEDDYLVVNLTSLDDAEALGELAPTLVSPLVLYGNQDAIASFTRTYNGCAFVPERADR